MKIFKKCFLLMVLLSFSQIWSQGPPITADKPIMLGGKTWILKTLTKVQNTPKGTVVTVPVMVHYLPSSNSLIAFHIPYMSSEYDDGLGNIEMLLKYQFYRKDKTGKTLRAVLKNVSRFATSDFNVENPFINTNTYQNYTSVVLGFESIRLGVSNEIGYNYVAQHKLDEWRLKSGIGWPLLKPTYPVKQLNLYFETQLSVYPKIEERAWFYSQGIQYAFKRWTFELAYQFPVLAHATNLDYNTLFIGTRVVL